VTSRVSSAPDREVIGSVVTHSSDEAFHCIAITIFHGLSDGASSVAVISAPRVVAKLQPV
jgi:hypothetical protein